MTNIISIILLIVSIATFALWINPIYTGGEKENGIKQLKEKDINLSKQISNFNKIGIKRKKLKNDYTKLLASQADAIEKLNIMVPNDVENAKLVAYIQSIKSNSISDEISDIKINKGGDDNQSKGGKIKIQTNKDYKSVNLSFSFVSQYYSFLQFLNDLYKSLRIVDIVSITVSPLQKGKVDLNQDKFKFDIVIRTY